MVSKLRIVSDFAKFMLSALVYAVYCSLYAIVSISNNTLSRAMGHSKIEAQLGEIFWKRKLSQYHDSTPRDFLCLSFTRVQPEYVLKPNISLYCVTSHEAVFVETREDVNIYNSDENPFFFNAQFNRSKNIIRMSMKCFHELAEKIGNSSVSVIWLSNIGRCGSTMVSQIFESVPGTLVMAEPDSPQNVYYLRQNLSDKDYYKLLESTVRVLCKPHPGTERFFIKPRSTCTALMSDIAKVFPDINHLFLYRNCLDTVSSFRGAFSGLPYTVVLRACTENEFLATIAPFFRKQAQFHIMSKNKHSPEIPLNANMVGILTHMWANHMLNARDAISRDKHILPIKYEHFIAHPMETCKRILENTGVDLRNLDTAVSALNKDSQRGSVLSRSRVGNDPGRQLTTTYIIKANAILSIYNLPCMGEDFVL